ncbi:response regulator [Paraflavitalea pollutisoli]|uniref:response regulator n=1 Tax=Paraflavitalea pollutisoli TaxID=3034143 RepID=UPI0023EC4B52|nr:response regulator [Paraflavitalea sp. H1-2-19X]
MYNTLLLVDDDTDDAELFVEALQEIDDTVTCYAAADGRQALEHLDQHSTKPDIIFLDINMPGMNGWQCLTELKENPANKNIPVIIYSTSAAKRDRDIAAKLGALGFITKPADYQELKNILRQLLSQTNEQQLRDSIHQLTA